MSRTLWNTWDMLVLNKPTSACRAGSAVEETLVRRLSSFTGPWMPFKGLMVSVSLVSNKGALSSHVRKAETKVDRGNKPI